MIGQFCHVEHHNEMFVGENVSLKISHAYSKDMKTSHCKPPSKVLLLSYIDLVTKPLIHVALCNMSGLYRRYKMTYREWHYENMANIVLQVLQFIA